MKEETKNWLKKAEEDLGTAEDCLKSKRFSASAFFCQQAIEKALKALEIERLGKFDKTHDLYFLGKKLNLPKELVDICEEISEYYVETRYPDTYAVFEETKVSGALKKTRKVIEWTKKNF